MGKLTAKPNRSHPKAMRAIPIQLILGLAALVAFTPFKASAARPILEVWTATPNPQGVSSCPPCNKFWSDYKSNQTLQDTLNHAFEVRARFRESNIVEANLKLATRVPTFLFRNHRVVGYTTPEDLIARLGLRPIQRQAPPRTNPPPSTDGLTKSQLRDLLQPYADRLNGLQSNLEKNSGNVDAVAEWLKQDRKSLSDIGLQIQVINEQLGRLNGAEPLPPSNAVPPPNPLPPSNPTPAPQPAPAPSEPRITDEPDLAERVLEFGKYPATWLIGPLGGAGATALLWLYQRRKKKAITSANEPSSPCADLIQQRNDALQQIALLEAELKQAKSRPAKNPDVNAQIKRLSDEKDEAIRQLSALETELEQARKAVRVVKETKYKPVENRLDAEAYEFAFDALVDKHPPAEGNVAFIKSVAQQYRDGKLATKNGV